MILMNFLLLALCLPAAFAKSQETALVFKDAEKTFAEYDRAIQELIDSKLSSASEFDILRSSLNEGLKQYCDSLRKYQSITDRCQKKKIQFRERLDSRFDEIRKSNKEDEYKIQSERMIELQGRLREIRRIREHEKSLSPEEFLQKAEVLQKDFIDLCSKVRNSSLQELCEFNLEVMKVEVPRYENQHRNLGIEGKTTKFYRSKKSKPHLQCTIQLPMILGNPNEYLLTDMKGRFRFEFIKKVTDDYRLTVPLENFGRRPVDWDSFYIYKKFFNPTNSKQYSVYISSPQTCFSEAQKAKACKVESLFFTLAYLEADKVQKEISLRIPISMEKDFQISLALDRFALESVEMDCRFTRNLIVDEEKE